MAWDLAWLALARAVRHSSVPLLTPSSAISLAMLAVFGLADRFAGQTVAYVVLLVLILLHMGRLMGEYDKLYAAHAETV